MHDPKFLLYDVPLINLDIWHNEPRGHDAGTICRPMPPNRGLGRLLWGIRHARHLNLRWWPYLNVRRWITDRCDECGIRFRWKQSRHSYQSTDKVWHDKCMSLRHVRGQLDDITGYVRGTANDNARWRVEYRLKHLDDAERRATPAA